MEPPNEPAPAASAVPGLRAFRWLRAAEPRGYWVLGLFTFVTRLPLLTYPKGADDEQVYAVVAMEMLRGGRPYIDAVERKPPLLFYVFDAIFRVGGDYNYFAVHVAAVVWTLATMALIYVIARRIFDATTGFVAALLYATFIAWASYTNLSLNGELLMNLPVVAAFAIAFAPSRSKVRLELVVAGALIAVAFLLKQPSGIAGVPLGLYVLHRDYRAKRGLAWASSLLHGTLITLGFASTLVCAGWLLLRAGIFSEAWYWTVGNHVNPFGPTTWFFWHTLPLNGTLFVVETLPLLLGAALSIREGMKPTGFWRGHRAELSALLILLGVSAIGVGASGQFLYHYFIQLVLPLALLAAPSLAEIWSGIRRPRARILQPVFLARWLAITALVFLAVDIVGVAQNRVPKQTAVYVREHSGEDDRFFVWGQGNEETGLYLDARRRPATRYIASFPLTGHVFGLWDPHFDSSYRIVPGAWDNLRADFARHPPKFIVDCHAMRNGDNYKIRDYPVLRELLTGYREVFRAEEGIVYARRED